MTALLRLDSLTKRYGSVEVVQEVCLTVEQGERRAVIGPNGAGKTTLFSMITGQVPVSSGRVEFAGHDITSTRQDRRARLGIAQTFQRSSLFEGLSVVDNVLLAAQRRAGVARRVASPPRRYARVRDRAEQVLDLVGLAHRGGDVTRALSHGERRQVEVALALACDPELILFDEPVAGLSPAETQDFVAMAMRLPAEITLLFIEHDIDVVRALASRVTVLDAGRLLVEGSPAEIAEDAQVAEAYLGRARSDDDIWDG